MKSSAFRKASPMEIIQFLQGGESLKRISLTLRR